MLDAVNILLSCIHAKWIAFSREQELSNSLQTLEQTIPHLLIIQHFQIRSTNLINSPHFHYLGQKSLGETQNSHTKQACHP